MHKINVLAFGSKNFNTSLEELKDHLNFKLTTIDTNIEPKLFDNFDVLLCHQDFFKNNSVEDAFERSDKIKILAYNSSKIKFDFFADKIFLPAKFEEINNIIENTIVKKNFSKNSSIKIKNYILDKNEKKLLRDNNYIFLIVILYLSLSVLKSIIMYTS